MGIRLSNRDAILGRNLKYVHNLQVCRPRCTPTVVVHVHSAQIGTYGSAGEAETYMMLAFGAVFDKNVTLFSESPYDQNTKLQIFPCPPRAIRPSSYPARAASIWSFIFTPRTIRRAAPQRRSSSAICTQNSKMQIAR